MTQEHVPNDELGMSEGQFEAAQKKLQSDVWRYEAERQKNPERLYFIFADHGQQERALSLIEEYRQIDDAFTYLANWKPNAERRADVGVEMDFSEAPAGLEEKVKKFFLDHKLELREKVYKVLEMPKRGGGKEEVVGEEDIAA